MYITYIRKHESAIYLQHFTLVTHYKRHLITQIKTHNVQPYLHPCPHDDHRLRTRHCLH